ncbi:MAG TPA: thiamine phosphate synthase [Mucilaginibacter sp.]|jgi:thiamine-phosphate pyrophosphorylase|nr:thiamine phosphate synthase [Mucilaginibacter sp.]
MIDKLHYISQQPEEGSHLTAIQQALEAGCKWIQLRVKNQPAAVILEYAIEANRLCNQRGAKLIVNDHPEIALKAGAYGVHLGLDDMPVSRARDIVGNEMIIGGTANTIQHIEQRIADGADYIGLGPYRFTTTKQKLSPILGWEGINTIMSKLTVPIPIIAIGGILPEDISNIMETGVYGVALSGAITYAANKAKVVRQMYHQLNAPSLNPFI